MTDTAAIARLIEPAVKELGFDLVRVAMIGGKSDPTLQVMAERPDTRQLTIDDCSEISRKLSDILDEADPIDEAYRLEISSPGIDRLLITPQDFAEFAGFEAKIELEFPQDGQKRFRGTLRGIEGDLVTLQMPDKEDPVTLPYSGMSKARLLLTDELIKASKPKEELPTTETEDTETTNNDE